MNPEPGLFYIVFSFAKKIRQYYNSPTFKISNSPELWDTFLDVTQNFVKSTHFCLYLSEKLTGQLILFATGLNPHSLLPLSMI